MEEDTTHSLPQFRPFKKRKTTHPTTTPRHRSSSPDADSSPPINTAVIRASHKSKSRKAGLDVSKIRNMSELRSMEVVNRNENDNVGLVTKNSAFSSRFTAQTGLVKQSMDSAMMAYIDSRLNSQAAHPPSHDLEQASTPSNTTSIAKDRIPTGPSSKAPTTAGRIQEIDLGPQATVSNILRTNQALNPQEGGDTQPAKKIRLGPDGKPWRSRRKRRGSEDIKRDAIVDAILAENRLDVYDNVPELQSTNETEDGNANADADEKMLESFKREYMDGQIARAQQQQQQQQAQKKASAAVDSRLKGPKLGGSRSGRAVALQRLEEQQSSAAKKK